MKKRYRNMQKRQREKDGRSVMGGCLCRREWAFKEVEKAVLGRCMKGR